LKSSAVRLYFRLFILLPRSSYCSLYRVSKINDAIDAKELQPRYLRKSEAEIKVIE